ncbi:TrkA domain-containing protein [Oscillochloris trichoides DG-6]|uniref:Trk system potassium uptake protein TrkA n=1 Tax=Oscillochloris trichoides DG-6 TaxID=765420 RepID=E1IE45_9CHLR|nr:TrkA family potassium uptake protein [Oscillochloris trichoides]EFO80505.1 TrkA domain-containing protein [Oscillochloris trichoides DG-6]
MRIIILGCGRVGAGLVQHLSLHGHEITIVDSDPSGFARLAPGFHGRMIVGDVLDRQVLLEAQIERSDALVAVTTSDDVNIVVARLARLIFRVPRVVARVYDPPKAEIYHRLGIQTVTTTAWTINRISELLSYSELDPVASVGDQVEIVAASAPPLLVGQPISRLSHPGESQVVAISRNGKTFLPQPGTLIEAGDLLHLTVISATLGRVAAQLRH